MIDGETETVNLKKVEKKKSKLTGHVIDHAFSVLFESSTKVAHHMLNIH